jgi:predicted DNA-binding protein (UPF0251 family)
MDIETKFTVEQGMAFMSSIFSEPSEEALRKIDRIKNLLDELPPREADFLEMYYFRKMKQTDIAMIFGVSQPTVHYRLNRAASRIKFLLCLPDLPKDTVLNLLRGVFTDQMDIDILLGMWSTTCQSEVAKQLGVSQGLVRHRFLRSISKMWEAFGISRKGMTDEEAYAHISSTNENSEEDSLLGQVIEMFESISQNLNLMREVLRSPTDSQVVHQID